MRSRLAALLALVAVVAALAALIVRGPGSGTVGTAAPPDAASALLIGVTAGGADPMRSAIAAQLLGARHVRVEFDIGTPPAAMRAIISDYANRGIVVLPLAGFYGRIPSPEEARNLAGWAREYGPGGAFWTSRPDGHLAVRRIEFGNETSFADQGTEKQGGAYAKRFSEAFEAVSGPDGNARVGLLAQADDGGTGTDDWVDSMFDAVPDLAEKVDGWTVHPYGPPERWQEKIDRLLSQTADRNAPADIPMDITEWGLATDGGRCLPERYGWDPCMTSEVAADALRSTIAGMQSRYGRRLRSFYIYQATDQQPSGSTENVEHYFGALRADLGTKGAYTEEVQAQVARTPAAQR